MAPRLDTLESYNRKPLSEMNNSLKIDEIGRIQPSPRKPKAHNPNQTQKPDHDIDSMLKNLEEQLAELLKSKPGKEMVSLGKICLKISDSVLYSHSIKARVPP